MEEVDFGREGVVGADGVGYGRVGDAEEEDFGAERGDGVGPLLGVVRFSTSSSACSCGIDMRLSNYRW